MKRPRYSEQQIYFALSQADHGTSVSEIRRRMRISESTFYRWKKKRCIGPDIFLIHFTRVYLKDRIIREGLNAYPDGKGRSLVYLYPLFENERAIYNCWSNWPQEKDLDDDERDEILETEERYRRRCQTKTSCFAQPHNRQISGRKLTPLRQGGGTIEFEVFAIVKMAFLIEMIVD